MTLSDIVKGLESDNSRLRKEEIIGNLMDDTADVASYFCGMAMRAYNPYETFGVSKSVPTSDNSAGLDEQYANQIVSKLMDELADRTLTGNAARDEMERVAQLINKDDWNNFYRRVLLKDLKVGVNITTWNKVAKKKNPKCAVTTFNCQLAHDGAKEKAITGSKLIEVKLDGVRVISIVYPNGNVEMYSRNGKVLTNFPMIADQLSMLKCDTAMVYDGEVMSSSFQDLMKQVYRKSDVQTDDAILYLFDMVPLSDFQSGKGTLSQYNRSTALQFVLGSVDTPNVELVNQELVDLDTIEGQVQFKDINEKAVKGGYEGIMLKDPDAIYECKRSKSWLKIKPVIEVSLKVASLEEGTGKFEGNLGALVCEGTDDGTFIKVNVGSGLTDELREQIWANQSKVIGQMVEIKADAITQNQDGTYSLRFPRFKTFRGFEIGEKL